MIIYWIHLPKHTDKKVEGYIGITSNFNRRMAQYKRSLNTKSKKHYLITNVIRKYGWDSLVIEIIGTYDSLEEVLLAENKLRPIQNIDWNIMAGGGNGHNHSENTKTKISKAMIGNKNTNGFSSNTIICPKCNKEGQYSAMKRWHFDNCKYY